ncbi:hypothetical protein O0L34_g10079 [Tuta absoluta]|nr:hypothetical protein O0L34_g10079 [Tuta absoluta]
MCVGALPRGTPIETALHARKRRAWDPDNASPAPGVLLLSAPAESALRVITPPPLGAAMEVEVEVESLDESIVMQIPVSPTMFIEAPRPRPGPVRPLRDAEIEFAVNYGSESDGSDSEEDETLVPPVLTRVFQGTLDTPIDEGPQVLQKKKSRLTNADVYGDDSTNAPIFINEDLPKPMKQLLWSVKNELKPKPFKYVWVQDGKILLKREDPEDRKIWVIRTADDLARVKAEAGRAQKAKAANT